MRRRTGFLVGILFELLAIFGLFVPYVLLTSSGTEITLRTVPVDPRSMFRGDYVTLGYEAAAGIKYSEVSAGEDDVVQPVFLVLEKKGDIYERVAVSKKQPALKEGQVCLRGNVSMWINQGSIQSVAVSIPDLAQYFVEEGIGRELESARNAHRLLVKAVVSPSCMAVLKGVVLGPEVPPSELPPEMRSEPIVPVM